MPRVTRMARAFFDHYDQKRQKARRMGAKNAFFVSSGNGSDLSDGNSESTAWATLAKATAAAPDDATIYLERDGHWRESLDVTKPDWTVAAYGSGAHPIIDASNRITGGAWVKEAGYTNIYRYTLVNPAINAELWVNVWQDDQFMTKQVSLAALDGVPGGYHFVITTGVGAVVYIHATGSGNPAGNGRTYDVTQRLFAVTVDAVGFVMDGIETRRQIHNNGSFVGGGTIRNCRFIDGHKHNALIGTGSTVTGCHFEGSYYAGQNASYAVTFAVDATGAPGVTYTNCQFTSRGDAIANPILSHAVSGMFSSFTMDGCTFSNFSAVDGFSDAQTVTFRNCRLSNCTNGFSIGGISNGNAGGGNTGNGLVEDCHFLGGGQRFITCFGNGDVTVKRNKFYATQNSDGHVYSPGSVSLTVEDNIFRHRNFGFLVRSGGTVTASGNHFDTTSYVYLVPSYASLTSNGNYFLDGNSRISSTAEGDTQIGVYISASGQEASSTWDADGRPAMAFDYTAPSRFALSALPGLVACWDASYPASRAPGLADALPSLGDRILTGNPLTSAFAAPNQPTLAPGDRSMMRTDGGNSQRRFDAAADVGDNLFAGGGMISAVLLTASSGGVVAGKWSTTGWILFGAFGSTLAFEAYSDADVNFSFTIPLGSLFLLEFEWNSDTPSAPPVVRINGTSVTVTITNATTAPVDDSAATLCVGNRNWGTLATPWNGAIGEVVLLNQIPTAPQKASLRADMMAHWSIA